MKTVTKRELNQQTAAVLAQVSAGEDVVVTERGEPRWRIASADAPQWRDQVRDSLHLTPAKADPAPWPVEADTGRYSTDQVDELATWARGDP